MYGLGQRINATYRNMEIPHKTTAEVLVCPDCKHLRAYHTIHTCSNSDNDRVFHCLRGTLTTTIPSAGVKVTERECCACTRVVGFVAFKHLDASNRNRRRARSTKKITRNPGKYQVPLMASATEPSIGGTP